MTRVVITVMDGVIQDIVGSNIDVVVVDFDCDDMNHPHYAVINESDAYVYRAPVYSPSPGDSNAAFLTEAFNIVEDG